jgi:hypothetical protein
MKLDEVLFHHNHHQQSTSKIKFDIYLKFFYYSFFFIIYLCICLFNLRTFHQNIVFFCLRYFYVDFVFEIEITDKEREKKEDDEYLQHT